MWVEAFANMSKLKNHEVTYYRESDLEKATKSRKEIPLRYITVVALKPADAMGEAQKPGRIILHAEPIPRGRRKPNPTHIPFDEAYPFSNAANEEGDRLRAATAAVSETVDQLEAELAAEPTPQPRTVIVVPGLHRPVQGLKPSTPAWKLAGEGTKPQLRIAFDEPEDRTTEEQVQGVVEALLPESGDADNVPFAKLHGSVSNDTENNVDAGLMFAAFVTDTTPTEQVAAAATFVTSDESEDFDDHEDLQQAEKVLDESSVDSHMKEILGTDAGAEANQETSAEQLAGEQIDRLNSYSHEPTPEELAKVQLEKQLAIVDLSIKHREEGVEFLTRRVETTSGVITRVLHDHATTVEILRDMVEISTMRDEAIEILKGDHDSLEGIRRITDKEFAEFTNAVDTHKMLHEAFEELTKVKSEDLERISKYEEELDTLLDLRDNLTGDDLKDPEFDDDYETRSDDEETTGPEPISFMRQLLSFLLRLAILVILGAVIVQYHGGVGGKVVLLVAFALTSGFLMNDDTSPVVLSGSVELSGNKE